MTVCTRRSTSPRRRRSPLQHTGARVMPRRDGNRRIETVAILRSLRPDRRAPAARRDAGGVRRPRGRAAGRAHNREEKFNLGLFRRAGELGLLGMTVAEGRRRRARRRRRGDGARSAVDRRPRLRARLPRAHGAVRQQLLPQRQRPRSAQRILPRVALRRVDRRDVHDRAGGRHRRARHADPGAARRRPLRAQRPQDVHHQRRLDDTTLGDVFLVYAKHRRAQAISTFVVEKGFPGFSLGQRWKDKLGMRASTTAELVFDDCLVPAENLLGSEGESITPHDAQPRDRAAHARRDDARHRAALPRRDGRLLERAPDLRQARSASTARSSATSPRPTPSSRRRAATSTTRRAASTSRPTATASTPTPPSSSPRASPRRSPTAPSRSSAATATGRVRRRAPVARRQAARDRRRHARGAPEEHHQGSLPAARRSIAK